MLRRVFYHCVTAAGLVAFTLKRYVSKARHFIIADIFYNLKCVMFKTNWHTFFKTCYYLTCLTLEDNLSKKRQVNSTKTGLCQIRKVK